MAAHQILVILMLIAPKLGLANIVVLVTPALKAAAANAPPLIPANPILVAKMPSARTPLPASTSVHALVVTSSQAKTAWKRMLVNPTLAILTLLARRLVLVPTLVLVTLVSKATVSPARK